jgi:predicted type IV restriction endonuclease
MEFVDKIKALASRVEKQKDSITTEEACKNAFVMPFLNALGYDVFNPEIVVPEFTADVGVKKGEKVDYAIKADGRIIILVECKTCGSDLSQQHTVPIRLGQTPTTCRMRPLTGIELRVGWRLNCARDAEERAEGVERVEPSVEAERELVEIGL